VAGVYAVKRSQIVARGRDGRRSVGSLAGFQLQL